MSCTKYITSKIDNQVYCKKNGQFTRHLRKHNLTYKEYYEIYVTGITPLCICMKPCTFYQKDESYAKSCGKPECAGVFLSETKQNWTAEQRKRDSENKKKAAAKRTPEQIASIVEKASKTSYKKYGVRWMSQSDIQKQNSRKTKLERYGNEHYSGWEKSAAKNRAKTPEEQDEINEKRRQTNLERHGVECLFLRPDTKKLLNRGNASIKEYTLPSGKIIGIRGYENLALDQLLKIYNENELQIHDNFTEYVLETFQYQSMDRKRIYHPDIYIPKENLIIEVKSNWWWNGNLNEKYHSRLKNNLKKREAVITAGYKFQLWLFENKFTYKILEDEIDFQKEQEKFNQIISPKT